MISTRVAVACFALLTAGCQTDPKVVQADPQVFADLANVKGMDGAAALANMGFAKMSSDVLTDMIDQNTLKIGSSYAYYRWDDRVYMRDLALGMRSQGTWSVQDGNACVSVTSGHTFCTAVYMRGQEVLCWPNPDEYPEDTGFARACEILPGNAIPVPE